MAMIQVQVYSRFKYTQGSRFRSDLGSSIHRDPGSGLLYVQGLYTLIQVQVRPESKLTIFNAYPTKCRSCILVCNLMIECQICY